MSDRLTERAWAVHAALDAFDKWRVYLPAAAFNHSDGLRFVTMLSDAIASATPEPCAGCAALRDHEQRRAVICLYCAKSVGYHGDKPLPELVADMEAHDRICKRSPLGAALRECAALREALVEIVADCYCTDTECNGLVKATRIAEAALAPSQPDGTPK